MKHSRVGTQTTSGAEAMTFPYEGERLPNGSLVGLNTNKKLVAASATIPILGVLTPREGDPADNMASVFVNGAIYALKGSFTPVAGQMIGLRGMVISTGVDCIDNTPDGMNEINIPDAIIVKLG